MTDVPKAGQPIRLGLRANAGQFALLVGVNALVGAMVGQERAILPLIAEAEFGLTSASAALAFLVAFGSSKAFANLAAGALSDRTGRRPILIAGWLIGIPVPILIILAPDWSWVVAANVLLGINQGLTWSTTVIMKVDLVGPHRRGLALGLNEAAGYGAVAASALITGFIAAQAGLRPEPFLFGLAIAGLGLGASVLFVRETRGHARHETATLGDGGVVVPGFLATLRRVSIGDRRLFAASQAGLVNNLNDGMAWGLLPLFFAASGASIAEIAVLAAIYPAIWGVAQIGTGALSDRLGRRPLIVAGMLLQGLSIVGFVVGGGTTGWAIAAAGLGIGTALVYPTLMAAVSDVAAPAWRASAIGVYRLWRDLGFVAGAILCGLIADAVSAEAAILIVAALTALSGLVVAIGMRGMPGPRPTLASGTVSPLP